MDRDWEVMKGVILKEFPLLNDALIDEQKHEVAFAIQRERKRLHALVGAAPIHLLIASRDTNGQSKV